MEIFEKAVLTNLRFKTGKGLVNVSDVNDLSSEVIRKMANDVHKDIEATSDDIFETKTKQTGEQELRLSILVRIIETRDATKDKKVKEREDAAFNKSIDARILANEEKAMDSMSTEDLIKLKR